MNRQVHRLFAATMLTPIVGLLLSSLRSGTAATGIELNILVEALQFVALWFICCAPLYLLSLLIRNRHLSKSCALVASIAGVLGGFLQPNNWSVGVAFGTLFVLGLFALAVALLAKLAGKWSRHPQERDA